MPPVTKAGGQQFRKDVQFAEKDDEEQVAAGIVMVPDKADLQNDFAREETIREFADQFEAFVEAGEAGGGIMHAVFPSEWMALERSEVLDESEEIGGQEVQAGAWVQEWRFDNDELWQLVADGVLEGYSIGAIQVDWDGPFEQDDDAVEDVDTSEVPDDALVWELITGIIREVSAVDIPAVPDAEILETKSEAEKRLGDHLGNQEAFIDEALERGHTEAEAERLWTVLNDAMAVEGSTEPGKQSMLAKAGKAFLSALSGGEQEPHVAETSETDPREGRSKQEADESDTKDAADGDTSADGGTDAADSTDTDMSNDDPDGGDGDKSLAEQNAEQINELTDAVKSLTEAVDGDDDSPDGDKTAEVELPDGTVAEVSKEEAMGWFEDDGGSTKTADEEVTKADIEAIHARLDQITREAVGSQQLDAGGDDGDNDRLDDLGKALS